MQINIYIKIWITDMYIYILFRYVWTLNLFQLEQDGRLGTGGSCGGFRMLGFYMFLFETCGNHVGNFWL